jgi:hypothetical protein
MTALAQAELVALAAMQLELGGEPVLLKWSGVDTEGVSGVGDTEEILPTGSNVLLVLTPRQLLWAELHVSDPPVQVVDLSLIRAVEVVQANMLRKDCHLLFADDLPLRVLKLNKFGANTTELGAAIEAAVARRQHLQ